MRLFILRWNPNISSYKTEHHLDLIKHLNNNEQPTDFNWSIREHELLSKDDMFILQQVGTDHDGIAMIGKFKNSCYKGESWRKDGSKVYYADMWIMEAFDCNSNNLLSADRYEKLFPEIKWHGGHSGVVVEEDLDDRIVDQIEKDMIEAGNWEEDQLKLFVTWNFDAENAGESLQWAKDMFLQDPSKDNFVRLVSCLCSSNVLMPMHVELDEDGREKCFPMFLSNEDGLTAYPVFSTEEQLCGNYEIEDCKVYEITVPIAIQIIIDSEETDGLVLDPFTTPYHMDKDMCNLLLDLNKNKETEEE